MPTRAKSNKYAATSWATEVTIDLECPSGQLAQVRRPGVPGLIKAGVLDSLDVLTGIVQTDHIERVKSGKDASISAEDVAKLAQDKAKLLEALDLADKVVEYVVLQPSVLRPVVRDENGEPVLDPVTRKEIPLPDKDRVPGQVYMDSVELMDKMFIFQFVVGGVRDLETFRAEFGETVGSLAAL
jgi:hypothetical protein